MHYYVNTYDLTDVIHITTNKQDALLCALDYYTTYLKPITITDDDNRLKFVINTETADILLSKLF